MLCELARDPAKVSDIDPVAVKDSFELSAAEWDLFKILESADYRFNVVVLEFVAQALKIHDVHFFFLIVDFLMHYEVVLFSELARD